MRYIGMCIVTFFLMTASIAATTPDEIISYAKTPKADVAFYYENLVTGEQISHNEAKVFKAASTIKLPLVLYAYELASQGKLDLNSKMTYHSSYYYEGSGVIRYEPVGGKYTLRDLAEKSIVYSDNIAYSMLRAKVGEGNFKNYLRNLGGKLVDTSGYKTMNCIDFAKYIKAYYTFTLEYQGLGKELTKYWQNTIFNDHIPAGVPELKVGHKIGWLPMEDLYHDGGVVYHEQPYVLIIMTQGIRASKQDDFFQELTKKINTYHEERYQIYQKEAFESYLEENMVPIRTIAEELKAELIWKPEVSQTSIQYRDLELIIDIVNQKCAINGKEMTEPFIFYEDTIYLARDFILEKLYTPLRTFIEEMGGAIKWDQITATAVCETEEAIYKFDTLNHKVYKSDLEIDMPFKYEKGIIYIPKIEEIDETQKEEA